MADSGSYDSRHMDTTQQSSSGPGTGNATADEKRFDTGLSWRSAGPYRGGRVVAVAGDPENSQVFYFGSTGGGVWKTTDGGNLWQNVSDGFFKRASVGALAVAPSDPNVIYVGMGEATIRGNVSHGDGVYKSTDGGKTWKHLGLDATRNISKIRIHPQNPDVVYVAAFGHAHGPNAERGIYRSKDGGQTWEHVLFRGEDVGANELVMDPRNPRILYAAMWRARRTPHSLISGGEGCALYRSLDGGDTWTEITRNHGLPKGLLGKIGVAVSPARTGRVWAIIESEDSALYRSDDGGDTWEKVCDDRGLRQRPWYYQHLIADPTDPDTLWVLNVRLWRSTDGGRTFNFVAMPHGDHHDLWIDPRNPRRMIEGSDGGACVSFNGGESWTLPFNQPTAEFYHVTTDTRTPYRIYGAQQDNTTISIPSRSSNTAILISDYAEVGGGESGYIAVRPDNPNIVYAGSYQGYVSRFDRETNERREITVWPEAMIGWPAKDTRYRFQWTFPIMLSPHDPNVLFVAGNRVFRTTDEGASWEAISPDLTRSDTDRLQDSGGPLTRDNCGTEYYATIFAFAESPRQQGLFWAGSDDGLVHISRDGGQSWQNVTPPALPEWSLISIIEPSPHDPAVAYVAAHRYKLDDFRPYLFKTDDYGAHWTQITGGLPEDVFARVIREDPARRGLLYAGTETGVWVSFDDGARWQSLQFNLPVVPVHDLVIKDNDIVLATHGRSFWVMDNITPLRQWNDEIRGSGAHLFSVAPTIRYTSIGGWGAAPMPGINYMETAAWTYTVRQVAKPDGTTERIYLDAGQNPEDGVCITYYLDSEPTEPVRLTFLDTRGNTIASFSSEERMHPISIAGDSRGTTSELKREQPDPVVPKKPGFNRFHWDTLYPPAKPVEGYVSRSGVVSGPPAVPGTYRVRLEAAGKTFEQEFEIRLDPRVHVAHEDLVSRFDLLIQIRDKLSETHDAIHRLRSVRRQVEEAERRSRGNAAHEQIERAVTAIRDHLNTIEGELIEPRAAEDDDTLRFAARLNYKLAELMGTVSSANAAPTRQAREVFADVSARVDAQLQKLQSVIEQDVQALVSQLREADVLQIVPDDALAPAAPSRTFAG